MKGKSKHLSDQIQFDGSFRVLIVSCAVFAALLVLIHVCLTIFHYQVSELPWLYRELFDVDEEESVPTWFSSMILLLTSVTLMLLYSVKRRMRDAHRLGWLGLAAGFFVMSIDEIAGFHEAINSVTSYSWAVPGLVLALMILVFYTKFLVSLPRRTAVNFVIAGATFVGGAVGVELATEPFLYNDELDTLAYNLWTAVEEGMEMGGVIYFLYALNQYSQSSFNVKAHVHVTGR